MRVVVIIGDVVGSRQSRNRKLLQEKLAACVGAANQGRGVGQLLSPYTITLGDEVQCVYSNPEAAVRDVLAFKSRFRLSTSRNEVSPYEMRFCLGVGEITTRLNRRSAIGMDGPAFYRARDGIEELKDSSSSLAVKAEAGIDVGLEDATMKFIDVELGTWRETRFKVFLAVLDGTPAKEIAVDLDISPVAVYKNIADGRFNLVQDAANAIGRSLHDKTRAPSSQSARRH